MGPPHNLRYVLPGDGEPIRDDVEHFLSLLTCKGEKEVRLFLHNFQSEEIDITSDVYTLVPVLDKLMKTNEQSVHTLALPIGYISRGSLKCAPGPMYADERGYHAAVIQAFINFLHRVRTRHHMLAELCVPVFRLHAQGTVDMGLKDLLVADCVAMHNLFMDESTWDDDDDDQNKQNMQTLFDSVFASSDVRTISFYAKMTNGYNQIRDWTSIHNANHGRTFHCFANYMVKSYTHDEEFEAGIMPLYITGCKNLRWVQ